MKVYRKKEELSYFTHADTDGKPNSLVDLPKKIFSVNSHVAWKKYEASFCLRNTLMFSKRWCINILVESVSNSSCSALENKTNVFTWGLKGG